MFMGLVFLSIQLSLCLLVGAFKPFTFKVIIDRYIFKAILSFDYFLLFFFKGFIYLFLGEKGEGEREKYQGVVPSLISHTGHLACNPGMR